MRHLGPAGIVVVVIGFLLIVVALVVVELRFLHPEWWRRRWVRRTTYGLAAAGVLGFLLRAAGHSLETRSLVGFGTVVSVFALVSFLALLISLLVSGVVVLFIRGLTRITDSMARRAGNGPLRPDRRAFLVNATAAIPTAALVAGGGGLVGGAEDPILPLIRVPIPNLPEDLVGLRILQLTDVHLGTFVHLDEIERTLERAERHRPDLVVLTGDICDRNEQFHDQLALVRGLRPRFGFFASLGNHEYYRGVEVFEKGYERFGIPLLVDRGLHLNVGSSRIWIAGADDPALMGRSISRFLERSIERALSDRWSEEFTLVLSHRPDGFIAAAKHHVQLTLSGHTHGGQIGVGTRSLFEPFFPSWYLRGLYHKGRSALYTSSGFGHWLPYRLNCPAEAPILVLEPRRLEGD